MTRDWNLIRTILFEIEGAPAGRPIQRLNIPEGVDNGTFMEHLRLLIAAGLVDGDIIDMDAPCFAITGLSWNGHDFLEKARDESTWNRALSGAKAKGIGLTFDVLSGVLVAMITERAKQVFSLP